ncbi:hypothetical protein VCHC55A1_3114, partial [Vibrio cholerae HC-55A1]
MQTNLTCNGMANLSRVG